MLATLGAQTILAAVVGHDEEGQAVNGLLDNLEINRRLVLTVDDRVTTVKQRLLGRAQHRYPHHRDFIDVSKVDRIVKRPQSRPSKREDKWTTIFER